MEEKRKRGIVLIAGSKAISNFASTSALAFEDHKVKTVTTDKPEPKIISDIIQESQFIPYNHIDKYSPILSGKEQRRLRRQQERKRNK